MSFLVQEILSVRTQPFILIFQEMRANAISELMLEIPGGQLNASNLEDLQLTFQYSPSSSIFTVADNPVVDLGKKTLA